MIPTVIPASLTPFAAAVQAGETVMAVDCGFLLGPDGAFPVAGMRHVTMAELGPSLLADAKPNCVIVPLFTAHCDAMTVVERLEGLGYAGRIAVLAPDMPQPRLVEGELRALGPDARLVLISP